MSKAPAVRTVAAWFDGSGDYSATVGFGGTFDLSTPEGHYLYRMTPARGIGPVHFSDHLLSDGTAALDIAGYPFGLALVEDLPNPDSRPADASMGAYLDGAAYWLVPVPRALDYARAVRMVADDVRESYPELSDAEAVAQVRSTMRLPEDAPVIGANALEDDGTPLASAYRAVLSHTLPDAGIN